MMLFLPVIVLVLAFVVVQILQWVKPGLKGEWIIHVLVITAVWLFLIAFPLTAIKPVAVPAWFSAPGGGKEFGFELSPSNWMIVVITLAYVSTLMITRAISENDGSKRIWWNCSLLLLAGIYVVLVSRDLVLILAGITLFDLVQLISELTAVRSENSPSGNPFRIFIWKVVCSLIILAIGLVNRTSAADAAGLSVVEAQLILLFPALVGRVASGQWKDLKSSDDPTLHFIQQMIQPTLMAMTMLVASKFTVSSLSMAGKAIAGFLLLGVAFFAGIGNLKTHSQSIRVRNLGVVFLSGILLGTLNGISWAGVFWIPEFLIIQSSIVLFPGNQKRMIWLPIVLLIAHIGFPFNPFSPMWETLLSSGWLITGITVFTLGLVITSILQGLSEDSNPPLQSAGGIKFVYVLAILLFVMGSWVVLGQTSLIDVEYKKWWIGSACVAASGFFLFFRWLFTRSSLQWGRKAVQPVVRVKQRLDQCQVGARVDAASSSVFYFLRAGARFLTAGLEGESGLLWAVLLFVAVMTLLGNGAWR